MHKNEEKVKERYFYQLHYYMEKNFRHPDTNCRYIAFKDTYDEESIYYMSILLEVLSF